MLLKPRSITSIFDAKPSTIAKKRKPPVIVIDADEGPDQAVSVADKAASEKGSRIGDIVYVLHCEGVLVSFHVVVKADDAT